MKGFPNINPIVDCGRRKYQISEYDRELKNTKRLGVRYTLCKAIEFQQNLKSYKVLKDRETFVNNFIYIVLDKIIIPAVVVKKDGVNCLFTIYTGTIKYLPLQEKYYLEREKAEKDLK